MNRIKVQTQKSDEGPHKTKTAVFLRFFMCFGANENNLLALYDTDSSFILPSIKTSNRKQEECEKQRVEEVTPCVWVAVTV